MNKVLIISLNNKSEMSVIGHLAFVIGHFISDLFSYQSSTICRE